MPTIHRDDPGARLLSPASPRPVRRSTLLSAYLALTTRAEGYGNRLLTRRLARGKEDPDRIAERRGEASQPRPEGPLIWFHAASVGESLSLLEVIRRLGAHDPALSFLVTTGTRTSAELLAARMPPRCIHQFAPLDVRAYVSRFLAHWHPDLAIWTESEFWPTMIVQTDDAGIPMLLINGRMSEGSIRSWRWLGRAPGALLDRFAAVQVQDDLTANALRQFGLPERKIAVTGTLKEGTPPPPCDETERQALSEAIGGRPVWLAASTHAGEEEIVLDAQTRAAGSTHNLLLILAPRHPERGDDVARIIAASGLRVARRSTGEPITRDTQVYLADTLGEMGLWYRIAPVSFVGGSLMEVGGHNPFEPAALGSAIIHGPHVQNFADVYARLSAASAAIEVRDAESLAVAVDRLIQPEGSAPLAYAAWEISSSGANVTDRALSLILDHLPDGARVAQG
ncbi:MAG: 3-deoxy-D-manno-octulosonic acid transferase [Rhodobacteraceae bacterium]|nr:3-deoxy-D-manno-octulosonic acid transferase [Paracoccaceae bacterium]